MGIKIKLTTTPSITGFTLAISPTFAGTSSLDVQVSGVVREIVLTLAGS